MKTSLKILTLLCVTVLLFSAAGVYAIWSYDETEAVYPVTEELEIRFFPWEGSELLPDEQGYNHFWLIENLLNGKDANGNGIGLNHPNSELNQNIDDRWSSGWFDPQKDTVGSMSTWIGGNLDSIFGTEAANLEFLIEFIDTNKDGKIDYYYIYTVGLQFSQNPAWGVWGSPYIPYGKKIYPIYRTKVEKNSYGEWGATESELGFAESDEYDASTSLGFVASIPSFDQKTWEPLLADGSNMPGQSTADPLWTYVGLENSITVLNTTTNVYYAIRPLAAQRLTINCADADCNFTVYNANMQEISRGTSWNASTNTTYYIAVNGAKTITFTINGQ